MPKPKTPPINQINARLKPLTVAIDTLRLNPKNTRDHDDRSIDVIATSLMEYGQQTPITIRKGVIIKGNGTWQAAKKLGWTTIAAVEFDKDEKAARGYGITDNRAGELSGWQKEAFRDEFVELKNDGWEPERFGWTEEELKPFLDDGDVNGAPLDEMPAAGAAGSSKKGPTATGEIWELGKHRLLCADATKDESWSRLMHGRKADLVFTDPPYGVSYQDPGKKFKKIAGDDKRGDDLVNRLLEPVFRLMVANASDTAGYYVWHASSTREDFAYALKKAGLVEKQYLIWAKPQSVLGWAHYQWSHEPCFYASKAGFEPEFYGDRKQTTVWRVGYRTKNKATMVLANGLQIQDGQGGSLVLERGQPRKKMRSIRVEPGQTVVVADELGNGDLWEVTRESDTQHPTQKPVDLARRAILNSTMTDAVVIDPFLGSGTTLIGAESTGRVCYGMEMERDYCEVIIQRWEAITNQKARLLAQTTARQKRAK